MPMSYRRLLTIPLVVLFAVVCWAGKKNFVMPAPQPAKSYPAHDAHTDEGVTVALDPYDMADKADTVFSTHYNEVGFLPVFMVVTNDSDQPISLNGMKAEMVTADRTKILAATEDDLYRRLSHPSHGPSPSPIPIPRKAKGSVSSKAVDEIQNSRFAARAVEPHSSQAGFLFFDVSGISAPLAGAHVYLTGVRDGKGNELMYFEIALEKYLSAPASTPSN
jgi:hypothetical protein